METVLINGVAWGALASISVGNSPFTWTNPESVPVQVFVSAGTVTTIEVANDLAQTFVTVGLLGGAYDVKPGAQIRVTYVLAPTMKYTPC